MFRSALAAGALAATLLTPAVTAAAPETDAQRPAPTPDARAASSSYPRIPALTDRKGRQITLRGWNVEDKGNRGALSLSAVTERHFKDLRANGFNFARLLFFWDDLEPEQGQYSKTYLAKIERVLDWAHKYDVLVLLDAHQDVFGPAFGHRGIPEWATRTDDLPFEAQDDWFSEYFQPAVMRAFTHLYEDEDLQEAQADMWVKVAQRFRKHPALIGYDPINEPMGELQSEDLVTESARIEAEQLTPMYNRIADAIRTVDKKTWIFVEPTPLVGEGVPTSLGKIKDPKIVYAPHFYNTAMEAGADYDPAAGWIEAYEQAITLYPSQHRIPVVVGEWGPLNNAQPHMRQFYRDAMASIGRYSSGFAAYVWCYGGGYCAVDSDGRFHQNKELIAEPYAEAVAGKVQQSAYKAGKQKLTVVYKARPKRGATVISTPGKGWKVKVKAASKLKATTTRDGHRTLVKTKRKGEVRVVVRRK
ncbi:glycoside hydrolase family 5 protein [Nocardioides daejeonensis]|uniref:glycoside hydrolase family 5 protein n=1 Tax=Nocardioides daejeonensis TaxID=1046556 RepID=UPI001EF543F9|nr:cellulase family glycosylhydrolase [Nocardioides daejeonensis]